MIFRGMTPEGLAIVGRAALLGLATLLVPLTPSMAQEAPDREESRRDSDDNGPAVVELADIEYTAGSRHGEEPERDRHEHRGRPEGRHERGEKAHSEMKHAQEALIKAARRIVELDERASCHCDEAQGPKHGERHIEAHKGPRHEEGRPEHHAGSPGPKHEADRDGHREEGRGQHAEHRGEPTGHEPAHHENARAEHREPKGEKPAHRSVKGGHRETGIDAAKREGQGGLELAKGELALAKADLTRAQDRLAWSTKMKEKGYISDYARIADDLKLRKARFDLEQAQTKKDVFEKSSNEKATHEPHGGHADSPQGHASADARINQIEKKLDELIRVVHEMKAHEGKDKK